LVPDDPLDSLIRGEKGAWEAFVRRYAGLVVAAVRGVARESSEIEDLTQEVFLRLCRNDFRLLRSYDPARAGLSTWLAVVARSSAVDHARRRRQATTPIDDVPETSLAVEDRHVEKLKIPEGLLTERQTLILKYLYDEERDVAEIAQLLKIDAQTVRSTHHKALLRLREHFREDDPKVRDESRHRGVS
jgi:RNA polymerase sigma factor (sigma-70 family)